MEKLAKEGDARVLKDMERLEKKLTKKEEEIEVVMNLHSEVSNLKKQIRVMKEQESVQRLSCAPSRSIKRPPKASHQMTKLLRQIQNYQQIQKGLGVGDNAFY